MLDKVMRIIAEKGIEDIDLVDVLARELAGMQLADKQDNDSLPDETVGSSQVSQNPYK